MELNHLRHFYEVAKAGSFTKAARAMRLSQSAISKTVALLEARENVKLLHRSKSGVALTPVGAEVFARAESIFATVTDIENTCRGFKETCEGVLRFGASDHVSNYLLTPRSEEFHQRYPALLMSVFSGTPNEIVDLVLKSELEFGLFFTKVNSPGIVYEVVKPVEMAIVYRPDVLPPGKLSPSDLPELMEKVGFISSIRKHYNQHPSQGLFELIGKDPKVTFESSSQETQKRLCLAGGGFAYLARFMVEEELKDKKLKEFPLRQKLTLNLLLAKKKGAPLTFNARTLLREIELVSKGG